jgi:hypothetical protein
MMRFRVEYVRVSTQGVAHVVARQLDPGDFRVSGAATLGGVPIHPWLDQPRAVTPEAHPETSVFAFALVNSSDREELTVGQVVELVSTLAA